MILAAGEQVAIENGPSKFDLMVGFFDRFSSHVQRYVTFTYPDVRSRTGKGAVDILVDSLTHESGDGHSWIFRGRLTTGGNVRGFYNSKTHQGFIKDA